jgi:hypothetical protein
LEEVQDPKYRFPLKNDTLHSLLYPNLDDLKLLQMSLDHESLKLDPKEKRLTGTVNVFDVDLKDHRQDNPCQRFDVYISYHSILMKMDQ